MAKNLRKILLLAATASVCFCGAVYANTVTMKPATKAYAQGATLEVEPNEDISNATSIAVNTACTGSIASTSDQDYYAFTLQNDGVVDVNFKHAYQNDTACRWNLTVMDDESTEFMSYNITGKEDDYNLPSLGLAAGTYYVPVRCYNYGSYTNSYSSIPYTLEAKYEASSVWEKEFNEDISNATPMAVNTVYNGSVMTLGDQDYYAFTLQNDGVVDVNFKHAYQNDTACRWNLVVMDDESTEFMSYNITGKEDDYNLPSLGLAAGTYYVRVRCYNYGSYTNSYSSIPYTLEAKYEASSVWEKEFNEDISNATPMAVNTVYNGSVMTLGDQDYYAFTLQNDGVVDVNFKHAYQNDTSCRWTLVVMDDESTEFMSYNITGKEDDYNLPSLGLAAGTYYVRVRCYNYGSYTNSYSSIPYTLEAKYEASSVWEKEFNEDISNATPMAVNTVYNGSVMTLGDQDYYAFTLQNDGVVDINFKHAYQNDTSCRWNLVVMDDESTEFMSYNITGKEDDYNLPSLGLAAGTYYVRVRCYNYGSYSNSYSSIPYTLEAKYEASNVWEKEFNTTVDQATSINLFRSYNGVIMHNSDVDYFIVENPSTDDLVLTFEHYQDASTDYIYTISLLDAKQNVLQTTKVRQNTAANTLTVSMAAAGKYYVKVATANKVCSEPYRIVVANPHQCYGSFETVIPAGCLTSGLEQKYCSRCEVLMEEKYIPAHGHFINYSSMDNREHNRYCSACDLTEIVNHEWNDGVVSVNATCSSTGEKIFTCKHCSETITEVIPMLSEHIYGDFEQYNGTKHQRVCDCGAIEYIDHNFVSEITREATCLIDGIKQTKCLDCGYQSEEGIGAFGHNYSSEWTIDMQAACETAGSKSHHCVRCDPMNEQTIIPATNHTYGAWMVTQSATCTAVGSERRDCENCNKFETREVVATGHNYETEWTIDTQAACETPGSKSHHCVVCGAKGDVTEIPATNHTYGAWMVTQSATCTAVGSERRDCENCNKFETREVVATGHNYETEWTIDTQAACETPGSKSHHCVVCGAKGDVTEIPATNHTYGAWMLTQSATCTAVGSERRDCENCNKFETREVVATGHNYETEWTIDTQAACETPGSKSHHCVVCGEKGDVTEIPQPIHTYGAWMLTQSATCTAVGSERRDCENCDKFETREVVATGHNYETEWTIDTQAACETPGSKSHHCVVCGAKGDVTEIPATNHTYDGWKVVKQATTSKAGLQERECACGHKETADIEKLEGLSNGALVAVSAGGTAAAFSVAFVVMWFIRKKKLVK